MAYGRNSRSYGRPAASRGRSGYSRVSRPSGRSVRRTGGRTRSASKSGVNRAQTIKIVLQTAPTQEIANPLLAPLQKVAPAPEKAKF